jgi:hypothetical protein
MTLSGSLARTIVPAAVAAFLLAGGQHAFADDTTRHITVTNKLSVDLTDGKVVNRQDVKVNTDPPKTIAAGDSGEFKTEQGDSGKNQHLKVQYTVGSGGSETVAFGYKVDGLDASCFTDTPSDISGSHNDCDYDDTSFEFSPK